MKDEAACDGEGRVNWPGWAPGLAGAVPPAEHWSAFRPKNALNQAVPFAREFAPMTPLRQRLIDEFAHPQPQSEGPRASRGIGSAGSATLWRSSRGWAGGPLT